MDEAGRDRDGIVDVGGRDGVRGMVVWSVGRREHHVACCVTCEVRI
jgi:hypothetical protein